MRCQCDFCCQCIAGVATFTAGACTYVPWNFPTVLLLEVSPEHRFFSNGEWVPIEELNVNDTLQLKDNSIVVIDNKIIFPTFVEVYNLEIEDNENYYVTEEGVLVHNGCRAIDNAQEYKKQIQDLYGGAKTQAERAYTGIVDGLPVNGIADNVVDGIAIEAKYVEDWEKSLRNPLDTHPWAISEQQKLVNQAKKYSDAFDKVIYHTNSHLWITIVKFLKIMVSII